MSAKEPKKKSKPKLRARANLIKEFRCKNLIAVIEHPDDSRNIGTIVRNVNALGAEKTYVITDKDILPKNWEEMREETKLSNVSASAIKWSFVKVFKDTQSCLEHLKKKNFVSIVTSPHRKDCENAVLHEHDYTQYKKLAVWFGNEGRGVSRTVIENAVLCINIPMYGIVESLNLGTSSGIVLYEITKQRRGFQSRLKARIAKNRGKGASVK